MNNRKTVYIAGVGILSPLGCGFEATEKELCENRSAISPLDTNVFSVQQPTLLPVGQVQTNINSPLPRTHGMAINAAQQAMNGWNCVPDAIVVGTTTGGILSTEKFLENGEQSSGKYQYHGLTTVAEEIATALNCTGPALTVSTACSSGTTAIGMGRNMLESGEFEWVLAGGADSLCKLTYYGFHSLQLVDPKGSRPLDSNRQGMSVAEGAAFLLLTTIKPKQPVGIILGCGLSCDAYHPASPHPEGQGAAQAMQNSLNNAQLNAEDIDYINLHGTGTPDNDLAESKAIRKLFSHPPSLSSIKGATGHSLAASGAIEAAIAVICLQKEFIPGNTGCVHPDPALKLTPLLQAHPQPISIILSNSFGFGGNNACLIIGSSDSTATQSQNVTRTALPLTILGKACITGIGHTKKSMDAFSRLEAMCGISDSKTISEQLPAGKIRRLKRFSRIAMALAAASKEDSGLEKSPNAVFMGTGWGALSETHDFLDKLRSSNEQFPSPIDFVGSVHNSAAGHIAIMHNATGPNITSSGGDYSFEQALFAAEQFLDDSGESAFVLAADEAHDRFSPLFDPSITEDVSLSDGGGGFTLCRKIIPGTITIRLKFFQKQTEQSVEELVAALNNKHSLISNCKTILAGIPAAQTPRGEEQLDRFMQQSGLDVPVIHYRKFTGEFAAASAVAAVMATHLLEIDAAEPNKTILVLGFGKYVTAMEFARQ